MFEYWGREGEFLWTGLILSMAIEKVSGSILSMVIKNFLLSCLNPVLGENFGTGSILGMAIEKVSCSNLSKVILEQRVEDFLVSCSNPRLGGILARVRFFVWSLKTF